MKTTLILIGAVMLIIAGIIGYNLAASDNMGASRESNVFRINDDGDVITESNIVGTAMSNPTDGAAASSTGGSLIAGTYYFKITTLDDAGGQTLPSDEFSIAIGTEVHDSTSSLATITLTPTANASATRLWVSTSTGVYSKYLTATSSVTLATTTSTLTDGTIPSTTNTAFNDINVFSEFTYYSTSTISTSTVKSTAGLLHAIIINTDAAGTMEIYDDTDCTANSMGIFEASMPVGSYLFDVGFDDGLCIISDAAVNYTVSYK